MDELVVGANLLLVIATAILAGVTVWYASSTRRIADKTAEAAEAARESAEAAKQLVEWTREEFLSARAPRLTLSPTGDRQEGHWHYLLMDVRNSGLGPAADVRASAYTIQNHVVHPMSVDDSLSSVIHDGAQGHRLILRTTKDEWLGSEQLVVICHYRHLDRRERLYHVVIRARGRNGMYEWGPHDYYGPEIPIPPEHQARCTGCQRQQEW